MIYIEDVSSNLFVTIVIPILTALVSGILGSLITLLITKHREILRDKRNAFIEVYMLRGEIGSIEFSRAVNRLPAFFDKKDNIMRLYNELLVLCQECVSLDNSAINDKFVELSEEIAKECKFKNIDWKRINKSMPYISNKAQNIERSSNQPQFASRESKGFVLDRKNGENASSHPGKKGKK